MIALRWQISLLITISFIFSSCTSKNLNKTDGSGDTRFTAEEGFIGENILVLEGEGISAPNLKNQAQKEASAREGARIQTMERFDDVCNSLGKACPTFFSGEIARKNPSKTKIKNTTCTPEHDLIRCRVSIRFELENIRTLCRPLAAGEIRRSDMCNAM